MRLESIKRGVRATGDKRPRLDEEPDQQDRGRARVVVFHHTIPRRPSEAVHRIGRFRIDLSASGRGARRIQQRNDQIEKWKDRHAVSSPNGLGGLMRKIAHRLDLSRAQFNIGFKPITRIEDVIERRTSQDLAARSPDSTARI